MSGNAAKLLSGPAGYAVPLVVGLVAVYLLFKYAKGQLTGPNGLLPLPAANQPLASYFFGIGPDVTPNPAANPDMGGADFGTGGVGW